jgi:hypothetical protein
VLLLLAYGWHTWLSAHSAMIYIPFVFEASDMFINLQWAKSIQEQGWLNPHPYHAYVNWMQPIGTLDEWTRWWGGEQIFQQSPLYAYFLALMFSISKNVLYVHVVQGLWGMSLCVLLGLIAARLGSDRRAGWIAFALAALYAPFYAYSWALLRDITAWVVTAGLLLVLIELTGAGQRRGRQRLLAFGAGLLLGFGYLTRESFALLAPLVAVACALHFLPRREYLSPGLVAIGAGLALLPLLIRNHQVGAPLFSTSNRLAEAIIQGHAGSASSSMYVIPAETRSILEKSDGRPGRVFVEALRTHPNFASWFRLQFNKMLSLFDPYEQIDNMNLCFFGRISPFVNFGLRHWMILIPGIGGLLLSLSRRDIRHAWLWLLLPVLMANLLIGQPLSRYRQFLMVLWIPWAAYFLVEMIKAVRCERRLAGLMGGLLVAGWAACLGPLAKVPPKAYDRPAEYLLAADIYEKLGDAERANEMREIVREKFPESSR